MSFQHGRFTFLSLAAKDLSNYSTTSDLEKNADEHDVTTYGKNSHVLSGGLKGGGASIGGIYDTTLVAGPRAVIMPLVGTVVELIRRTEGTGSGKPQDTVNVHVKTYKETSPVADMVTWTCSLSLSDDLLSTTQA
jgi:hypothetical protein